MDKRIVLTTDIIKNYHLDITIRHKISLLDLTLRHKFSLVLRPLPILKRNKTTTRRFHRQSVTEKINNTSFIQEHALKRAPLALQEFASVIVEEIICAKDVETLAHFDCLTLTVPNTTTVDPHYHSIIRQKLMYVDWVRMHGLDINCPRCESGVLVNDRINFSKNKILFPIFVIDGPPIWSMVMSMTCPCCRACLQANSSEILCRLPGYARLSYPVELKYAIDNKNSHIGSSATAVFELLMLTYGNGDLCS